jgi:hypothetical protein
VTECVSAGRPAGSGLGEEQVFLTHRPGYRMKPLALAGPYSMEMCEHDLYVGRESCHLRRLPVVNMNA